MSMLDSIFGFVGKDFVMCAADTTNARSIVVMKDDLDKIKQVDKHKVLGMAGEVSDIADLSEYIQKNVLLYNLRTNVTLNTAAVANFMRGVVAKALRSRGGAYQTNMVLGGYDEGTGPSIYYLDYLGTLHKVPFTAQGLAPYFVLSTMDRYWKPDMSLEEAKELCKMCIAEVRKRVIVQQFKYTVKVIDKDGVRLIDLE
eukprot:Plantae.Rhodophyta-Purpureofilum_apyrenoidigerum.ctg6877.p2 GENE.Plantae.Rhodophyta-Purpureofilum_apyrenoidigerum.ctg6877~~Plantae.Rhodophyta-Purpureofilum_apyrenoidigerum.ctg6877.p2  ORF type:complete len:199 (-),score=44.00 Plantae.Rhodophyta-Purpureofilum_apyrenoidigerum.ctg6877:687-1283(-)